MQINELFDAIMTWAASSGVENINQLTGCWHGKTEKIGKLGPFDVKINGHNDEREGVPPFHALIEMPEFFPGVIAIVGPNGGSMFASREPGEDEDGLIEHFRAMALGGADDD